MGHFTYQVRQYFSCLINVKVFCCSYNQNATCCERNVVENKSELKQGCEQVHAVALGSSHQKKKSDVQVVVCRLLKPVLSHIGVQFSVLCRWHMSISRFHASVGIP